MTPPGIVNDDCTTCGHPVSHHLHRDSGDDRPGACHFVAELIEDGMLVCACPGYTPRIDIVPAAVVSFDPTDDDEGP
jgi:hypothetical protein